MKLLLRFLACCFLAPLAASAAPRFIAEGLEIDAGSLGKFVLEYPQLIGADQQPVHKLHEKTPSGATASLKYEGGSQIDLAAEKMES